MKIIFKSLLDYFGDDGPLFSGSITYFFLMTIVPLSLLLVSAFGFIIGENKNFYAFLSERLIAFFPEATPEISGELAKLISFKAIGFLSMLLYFYFSYQLYFSLERAVNIIFGIQGKRPMWMSMIRSLIFITLIIVFVILSFGATWFVSLLDMLQNVFPALRIGFITGLLIGFVIPVFLVFLIASTLYIVLPQRKISILNALRAGLFTALALEVVKHLFTFYISGTLPKLGALYGSLTATVIMLLWIFYAATIFLIGAEIVFNLETRSEPKAL